ncbi:class I SAM-dependent methyltransferase [Pseudomonas peli]|uniref:class I SAM-dependent methyltransferase n=1 Tax=Pseudomonas peli TaxID=592361 RepID=UPI0024AD76F0|nr:class I SAM-dependent methyltransferase [Pseudomonas peli]
MAKPSDTSRQLAELLKPGAQICDLGAGGGRHAWLFASENFNVVAVDRNQQALKALEQVNREYPNCQVVGDDILSFLTSCESTFDAIVMWDCVHHVVQGERAFDDLARCLRQRIADQGYLLITFLSDICYPDQLSSQDRYLLSREAAARQLQGAFTHGWQLVVEKEKSFSIPAAEGMQGTSIVVGNYSATRLVRLYKAVPFSGDGVPGDTDVFHAAVQAVAGLQLCRESH